ncbi:serine/arginine repetitive matrix protein 1-like, partial [Mizuhopecten yessoensis]|uniref:serine/arginine repetitive matrix protein 1-like n=1 Tax=Mizuhopecten yessoensis TaxID=6573 RepID=UPI000B45F1FD
MDTLSSKKALYLHRIKSTKTKIDFADISTFDIAPTPPKEPKPEARKLHRRHRICAQKLNTYEAKYESTQESATHISRTEHDNGSVSSDLLAARDPAFPWYCPTPRTGNTSVNKEEDAIYEHDNVVKTTFEGQRKNPSLNEAINANPIRYPAPGPREQLAPSPFPVNKNKLAPVVDPRKNVASKPPRKGPRPVKAKHMPVYKETVKTTAIDHPIRTSLPKPVNNPNPIRYPAPGPREQLTPSPFPVNKNKLAPLVDPRKNTAVPKTPRKGPRPVKAKHISVFHDSKFCYTLKEYVAIFV